VAKRERHLVRRQVSTRFLRVPANDWPMVRVGVKTEFRTRPEDRVGLTKCYVPTPVIAYATRALGPESRLMVLEERRHEPLFNIVDDAEAIAREGFESYEQFRRYWRKRMHGRFVPLERVWVWRIRLFTETDIAIEGERVIRELYQEYL
jgi:hypothetical protein